MIFRDKKNKAKNEKELWALSLSAPLFQINGFDHQFLYGNSRKSRMARTANSLVRDWDISDHDGLMETLKWLETSGHQDGFMEILSFLTSFSEQDCERYITSLIENREKYEQYKIANVYKLALKRTGIAAWDIQRYVFLCRLATVNNLLSEDVAWDLILKVAQKTQTMFTSWQEYCLSYFAGRQYWMGNSTADFANEMKEIIKELLVHQDGIWHNLDWNTCLDE